jgi:hypothetical protein
MKQTIFLLALLLAVGAVHAAVQFDVNLLRYEPVPANPGDTIEVWVQVENTGDETANNVQLFIDDSYPFKAVSEADQVVNIGTLAARSEYVTSIRIAIDREAPQGNFNLQTRISNNGRTFSTFDLPIQVQGAAASLAVISATTSPSELTPGNKAAISIRVKNVEDTLLRDLTVKLDLDDTVFAPIGSTNQQKISRLGGGEETTITFVVIPTPDAASSIYRVPVIFNFTTNEGDQFSQEEVLGVVVRAPAELSLVVDESELYSDGSEGTLRLRLVNKGLSEVKAAEVTLEDGEGYEIVGNTRTHYVGNIDADDFETVEFKVKPTEDAFTTQLHVTYKDALNSGYEKTVQLPINTQDAPDTGSNTWIYVLLVLAIIGGIIWWRRSSGKRR